MRLNCFVVVVHTAHDQSTTALVVVVTVVLLNPTNRCRCRVVVYQKTVAAKCYRIVCCRHTCVLVGEVRLRNPCTVVALKGELLRLEQGAAATFRGECLMH